MHELALQWFIRTHWTMLDRNLHCSRDDFLCPCKHFCAGLVRSRSLIQSDCYAVQFNGGMGCPVHISDSRQSELEEGDKVFAIGYKQPGHSDRPLGYRGVRPSSGRYRRRTGGHRIDSTGFIHYCALRRLVKYQEPVVKCLFVMENRGSLKTPSIRLATQSLLLDCTSRALPHVSPTPYLSREILGRNLS